MVDKERHGPLVSMDVKDFVLTVGARSPTPGGGSVAALTASLVSTFAISLKPGFHSNATHATQSLALRSLRKRKPQETQALDWLLR